MAAFKYFHMHRAFIERVPRENEWRTVIDMQNMNGERERRGERERELIPGFIYHGELTPRQFNRRLIH